MPRGNVPMRVRRRQSDAKWRASVATCYDTLKHIIPNNERMPKRKISKALILQETEKHIINIENKLKELLGHKARSKGKTVLHKAALGYVEASLDELKREFSDRQHELYIQNCSQRKRSNIPSDIELGLIEMRSSLCQLLVVPTNSVDQYNVVPAEQFIDNTEQRQHKKMRNWSFQTQRQSGKITEDQNDSNQIILENIPLTNLTFTQVDSLVNGHAAHQNTEMSLKMEALLKTPDKLIRPKRPYNRKNKCNQVKQRETTKQEFTCFSPDDYNPLQSDFLGYQRMDTTPDHKENHRSKTSTPGKFSKQFDCNPGFTPVKLPEDHQIISPDHAVIQKLPFTTLDSGLKDKEPQSENALMPESEDFDASSLLCLESIDQMDLDDSFEAQQRTPKSRSTTRQKQRKDRKQHSRRYRSRSHGHMKQSSTSQEPVPIKREAKKCCRQLEKLFPPDEKGKNEIPKITGVFESTDNSCRDFDGYLLFYQQVVDDKQDHLSEDQASKVSNMWQNLSVDTRDSYVAMATYENSHSSSSSLSDDLVELDVEQLVCKDATFRTSTPAPETLQSHFQVVPLLEKSRTSSVESIQDDITSGMTSFDLQLVPDFDDLGVTPISPVKGIQEEQRNYFNENEVHYSSEANDVPALGTASKDSTFDFSIISPPRYTDNQSLHVSDIQSIGWNTQVVPQLDVAALSQHDIF